MFFSSPHSQNTRASFLLYRIFIQSTDLCSNKYPNGPMFILINYYLHGGRRRSLSDFCWLDFAGVRKQGQTNWCNESNPPEDGRQSGKWLSGLRKFLSFNVVKFSFVGTRKRKEYDNKIYYNFPFPLFSVFGPDNDDTTTVAKLSVSKAQRPPQIQWNAFKTLLWLLW